MIEQIFCHSFKLKTSDRVGAISQVQIKNITK